MPLSHAVGGSARALLVEYCAFFLMASLVVAARHLRSCYDVVQVNSVPDVLVLVGALPKATGARVLLDLQEPMPEFFRTKFGAHPLSLVVRLVARLEAVSIRFAHEVITPSE